MKASDNHSSAISSNKGLFAFLRHPSEDVTRDNSPLSLLRTVLWYFSTSLILVVGMAILITLDLSPTTDSDRHIPVWGIVLFLPIAEELAFRFPLRRKRWILTVWAGIVSYILLSMALSTKIYETSYLTERLIGCAAVTVGIWFQGWKWLRNIKFSWYFYLLAIAFGFAHLSNSFTGSGTTAGTTAFFLLYSIYQISGGLILGYARIRHGFLLCILLHVLTNLPAAL